MRKKKRNIKNPDGTTTHPVGQERFISVQKYVGDLPTGEPTDWFPQSDELEKHIEYELVRCNPNESDEILVNELLVDEH